MSINKKILIIILIMPFLFSNLFAGEFENNLKKNIGIEIVVYLINHNGEYRTQITGILKEFYEDHIVLYNNKEKIFCYIKLDSISTFIISEKDIKK